MLAIVRFLAMATLVGCSFQVSGTAPDGTTDESWSYDSAAEFAAAGTSCVDCGVEPWGTVTSGAYIVGGVLVHTTAASLWSLSSSPWTWTPVTDPLATGIGRDADLAYLNFVEHGITNPGAPFSISIEGELLLDSAGDYRFQLIADDLAFLDIAPPGTSDFARVSEDRVGVTSPASAYTPVEGGWHPFRIGYAQSTGAAELRLRITSPGQPIGPLRRSRLRVRAEQLRGTQRAVFYGQLWASVSDVALVDPSPLLSSILEPLPAGAPFTGNDWSARWSAQFYIEHEGRYTLAVTSNDGHDLGLGPSELSANFIRDGSGTTSSTIDAVLERGWNAIAVGYNQVSGPRSIDVRLAEAPDDALVGQPLPLERLRPVEPMPRVIPGGEIGGNDPINDNDLANKATSDIRLSGFADEASDAIEVSIRATAPRWQDLRFELERPGGPAIALAPTAPIGAGAGTRMVHFRVTSATHPSFVGGAVDGVWRVRAYDAISGGGNGILHDAYVTVRAHGGHPLVAPISVWTSEVRDLGDRPLVRVAAVSWIARQSPDPTDVEVRMRSCELPDCGGEPWSEPIANGDAPALVGGRRYVQLRVVLRTDGQHETELDRVSVDLQREP